MNRIIILILLSCMFSSVASAETFEEVIERQPPEFEKNFMGVTNLILTKTNNLLDGVLNVMTGVNEGDINSIIEGFQKGTDTFKKYKAAHKETLEKQLSAKESELANLKNKGTTGPALSTAYLELGKAATEYGDFAKAREAFAEALSIADENPDPKRNLQYDILLEMSNCAYDSYDTDYMLSVRNKLENLLADSTLGSLNQRTNAYLSNSRCDMRLGNTSGALLSFHKAYKIAGGGTDFDISDPTFHRLQIEILKKYPSMGLVSECVDMLNIYVDENSPAYKLLSPDILSQMLVVRADCYSRMQKHGLAFNDIFKARDMIHDIYPDGSIAELEYLVTLGELIRRNELGNNATVRNRYTDKGLLYHLNGCRILATRIWGDEKDGINPWLRLINSKLALAAVADYHLNHEKTKNYTKPSLAKVAEVIAKKGSYTASEEAYQKYSNLADESLKFARKLYKSELEYMRDKIHTDFSTMNESQRADYMSAMSELVNDIYNFAELDKKDKESAGMVYNATLLSKSVLLSFSRSLGSNVKALNDPELNSKLEKLNSLRREYVRMEQNGDFTSSADLRREAGEIERDLQHAVTQSDPGSFMTTTWKDIKDRLQKNDVAIEFYTFTDNLFGKSDVRERMVAIAANKNPRVFPIRYAAGEIAYTNPSQRRLLYLGLWQPLEKEKFLKAGGTVYFAPAGRWNGIPLEYLSTGKEGMNDCYRMVRVSTTRQHPFTQTPAMENPVLFGGLDYNLGIDEMAEIRDEIAQTGLRGPLESGLWNHLPGTDAEVNDIAAIFANNDIEHSLITGAEGIEESFKALSGGHNSIIHIATHGYYCPPDNTASLRSESVKMDEAMDRSGLVFSGANQFLVGNHDNDGLDDGLLTSREIALMDLSSTDLVVMSACETGAGHATAEGVLGLQRGFKQAGAKTLIMSLWKVNDQATAAMMSAFYRHLLSGKDKRTAFYAAREELRQGTYPGSDGNDIPGTDPLIGDAFVIMD